VHWRKLQTPKYATQIIPSFMINTFTFRNSFLLYSVGPKAIRFLCCDQWLAPVHRGHLKLSLSSFTFPFLCQLFSVYHNKLQICVLGGLFLLYGLCVFHPFSSENIAFRSLLAVHMQLPVYFHPFPSARNTI